MLFILPIAILVMSFIFVIKVESKTTTNIENNIFDGNSFLFCCLLNIILNPNIPIEIASIIQTKGSYLSTN